MDPMAEMEFKGLEEYWEPKVFPTKAHQSASKNPIWNETFEIRLRLDNT
jgi:Ca2+-dependent lipid-binding protein